MKMKIVYPLFIVLFLSFITGCYTVVEHPDVVTKDENGYTYTEEVYFYDNCNSCHKEMAPRNYTAVEKQKMAKAHREETDGTDYSEDSRSRSDYYYDGYYNDSYYYGDYGYFYSYPWWYNVAPVTSDSEKDRRTASEYKGARNNDGGRGNDGRGSSDGGRKGMDITLPTVNAGSSSGSSGSNSNKGSSDNSGRSSTSSSSKDSDRGSSSEKSNPRNNDGGRGSSGRR